MWEPDLVSQLDFVVISCSKAGGRPFTNAVQGQDRGLLEWRREKGTGSMGFVVIGEYVAAGVPLVESFCDFPWQVQFLFQPGWDCLAE